MKISDAQQLYLVARHIVDELQAAGETCWADRLNDAMGISNVGSEVMGELRIELRRLRQNGIPSQLGITAEVDSALNYLNAVLANCYSSGSSREDSGGPSEQSYASANPGDGAMDGSPEGS